MGVAPFPYQYWESNASQDDRSLATIGGALIEQQLSDLLGFFFIDDPANTESLLRKEGALSDTGARNRLALALGLIDRVTFQDIRLIMRIRNRFAHAPVDITFSDQEVIGLCSALEIPKRVCGVGAIVDIQELDEEMDLRSARGLFFSGVGAILDNLEQESLRLRTEGRRKEPEPLYPIGDRDFIDPSKNEETRLFMDGQMRAWPDRSQIDRDSAKVAKRASQVLQLTGAELGDEYYYSSLSLCVIDAIFASNARYKSVQTVVLNYCHSYQLVPVRPDRNRLPPRESEESLHDLLQHFNEIGSERMAKEVFRNSQRTSPRSGILKAEAVKRFADVLCYHDVCTLVQAAHQLTNVALERDIRSIPGQGSGISLQYFWMLSGADDIIKPDRMILRFLEETLARRVAFVESQPLLYAVAEQLGMEYPGLTPRLLDYSIWQYQRTQPKAKQVE